jgi:hypothetical protein
MIAILFALAAQAIQFPSSAERWGVFEVALSGPSGGNPYVDASLSATFTRSGASVRVDGFYDGDGTYRIRFMPPDEGVWTFTTTSSQAVLSGRTGSFTATSPSPGNRGPVRVRDQFHFRYEDGTPHHSIGTTCYNWTNQAGWLQDQTVQTLAAQRFNKVRFLIFPKYYVHNTDPPAVWPFEGSPGAWNFDRPVYAFWRNFEARVRQLRDLGIEADIIINNPYDEGWGLSEIKHQRAREDRHWRHIIARLAAYRNVWWSMCNEYEFWSMPESYWDSMFQLFRDTDPYGHLRSIHNAFQIYDHAKPWVTHASLQAQDGSFPYDRTRALRGRWGKPVVWDEVKYEGNIPEFWGRLTPQEMTERFWTGLVDGAYTGHSETYQHPQNIIWWSRGGVLHGGSPARIAFLNQFVRDFLPDQTLDPMAGDENAGRNGNDILHYFGTSAAAGRSFFPPAGIQYQVHVVDTWNMTRTDAGIRSGPFTLSLPNVPYLAVLLKAVGGDPEPPDADFVKGVNFNGGAVTVEGNLWSSYADALSSGLSFPAAPRVWSSNMAPAPGVDGPTHAMLNSNVWDTQTFGFSQALPSGSYHVSFWVFENHQSNYRSFDIRLEGATAASGVGTLPYGSWMKYGPFATTVNDGALSVQLVRNYGDPHVMGMSIHAAGGDPPPPPPPPASGFVKGINFNGGAVTIGGNAWTSYAAALADGLSMPNVNVWTSQLPPSPSTDAATSSMLNSAIWAQNSGFSFSQQLPAGTYEVYFWVFENHLSNYRSFDVRLEGATVASGLGTLPYLQWRRYGPYAASVQDGSLSVDLVRHSGDPHLMGMEIHGAGSAPPPPAGAKLHWPLDGSAQDVSGNGNHGTLSAGGPVWTAGRAGGGLDLDGAGDYVLSPASASLNAIKNQMTVSLWALKRSNAPEYASLAGRRHGPDWDDLWLLLYDFSAGDNYAFVLRTSNGSAVLVGPPSTGDHGAWTHVAAVYDGTSMILYRNGAEVARRAHSGTIPDEASPFLLGAGDNGSLGLGEYVDAVLDDVRVYDRALSAAELGELHSQAAARVLAGAADAGTPGGGSGNCGLLGAEVLLLLAWKARRRRPAP